VCAGTRAQHRSSAGFYFSVFITVNCSSRRKVNFGRAHFVSDALIFFFLFFFREFVRLFLYISKTEEKRSTLSCPVPISSNPLKKPSRENDGPSDWPMGFVETLGCLLRDRRDTPWHKQNISTLHPSPSFFLFFGENKKKME
jgi:hypothetical protein